jgi:hypothetical protein
MSEIQTTLGKRSYSDAVPTGLKQFVDERIGLAQAALDPRDFSSGRHIEALSTLSNSLGMRGLDASDPRMWALWIQQGALGGTDDFTPGKTQVMVLARVGTGSGKTPDPDTTLNEFIAAGVDDVVTELREKIAAVSNERAAAVELAGRNAEALERAEELEKELVDAQEAISGHAGEMLEMEAKVRYLSEMGIGDEQEKKPRRIKVEDQVGIYFYETTLGKEYEVTWTAEGKMKRAKAGPDLDEAVAERARLLDAEQVPA